MEKVRILSVGIGGFAQGYLSALLQVEQPDFEIVGMVDVAPERSRMYPRLLEKGVPLYPSMEAFYEGNTADLAIIVTPIHLHTPQILCALRHGSHVLCEKPLSGVSADEEILEKAMAESGKFVMIGYQWSYSKAILDLKQDITDGLYGKAEMLKSLVLWPRAKEYFCRGSGWGGRIHAPDGTVINDSVVSNATAHHLHNMLYVTGGAPGKSNEVVQLECNLLRTNAIENFDTATARFTLADGAKGIYVVSHSTEKTFGPVFTYRFEKGTVTFQNEDEGIVGRFADGTIKNYGNPFAELNRKTFEAIAAVRKEGYVPVCGVRATAPQVRCVEMIQRNPIYNVRKDKVLEKVIDDNHFLYIPGLGELLEKCYEEEKILEAYPEFASFLEK